MIALFNRSEETPRMAARREAYLTRLHEIFDEANSETVENNPAETLERVTDRVTEQIASKFTEALLFAFRATGMEERQTQSLRAALSHISERVNRVTAELSAQPRKSDSVILRLAALEEPSSEHQDPGTDKEEQLRQSEARTNKRQKAVQQQVVGVSTGLKTLAQADAIRSAHSDPREHDERLIQLRAALEKAREAFASMKAAKAQPEGILTENASMRRHLTFAGSTKAECKGFPSAKPLASLRPQDTYGNPIATTLDLESLKLKLARP